jgi:hypothetical protein
MSARSALPRSGIRGVALFVSRDLGDAEQRRVALGQHRADPPTPAL